MSSEPFVVQPPVAAGRDEHQLLTQFRLAIDAVRLHADDPRVVHQLFAAGARLRAAGQRGTEEQLLVAARNDAGETAWRIFTQAWLRTQDEVPPPTGPGFALVRVDPDGEGRAAVPELGLELGPGARLVQPAAVIAGEIQLLVPGAGPPAAEPRGLHGELRDALAAGRVRRAAWGLGQCAVIDGHVVGVISNSAPIGGGVTAWAMPRARWSPRAGSVLAFSVRLEPDAHVEVAGLRRVRVAWHGPCPVVVSQVRAPDGGRHGARGLRRDLGL